MRELRPAQSYLAALAPGSRRAMTQALETLIHLMGSGSEATPDTFDWTTLDGDQALAIRRQLTEHYAPATTNKMLAAMRGVMRAARDQGLIDEAQYQRVARIRSVKPVKPEDQPILTQAQLRTLFEATAQDPSAAGRRDAAVLAVILATGLRRAEAAELNLEHLDLAGKTLRIIGETADRVRTSPLDDGAARALADWVAVRDYGPGPLFLPTVRGGALRLRRLTDQALYLLIKQVGERAGLPEVTSRVLRRTMIVRAIAGGADRDALHQRAGHMSWLNAKAYNELFKLARRRRVKDEPLPYVPPAGLTETT